jgi:hypothetical protein
MTDDPRCCGSGTCIINDAGECWCGQRWDGQKMCSPNHLPDLAAAPADETLTAPRTDGLPTRAADAEG